MATEYLLRPDHGQPGSPIDYRGELNDQQYQAVSATGPDGSLASGPMLVIAGAGSGKTRTLTYRVAWMVEHGVAPSRILLLTFTNKAAREMLCRVGTLLPTDLSAIWGGTFHHVANRILRRDAQLLGFGRDFTILDREDAGDCADACLAEAGIDPKGQRFPKGDVLVEIWSLAVNTARSIEEVVADQYEYFAHLAGPIRDLRARYTDRKRRTNAMDYDDLLVNGLKLLKDHREVRELYQEQFQHVLVDEYQDTNRIQADLVDLISAKHHNVVVVGDDAQSIYSWRGADYRNILTFPNRYPGARIFKIELNYRSVPGILQVANAVIRANVRQFEKTLIPVRPGIAKPWLVPCADVNQQADFVAQRLRELREEGVPLREIAVLYRAHYHSMELQMELTRRSIPFVITSGLRFFEQAHIKDAASFLKLVLNPHDELAGKRVFRLIAGVGGRTADRLWEEIHPALTDGIPLPPTPRSVPRKSAADWRKIATVLNRLRADASGRAADLVEEVVEGFYAEYLEMKYPNAAAREEDLHQLSAFATQFESVGDFLGQLALLTNLDAEGGAGPANAPDPDCVRLSTVHQAKGQEWRAVFVIHLCDGLFPLARALDHQEGEEEERRLFYVAVTRAKDELYLSYPLYRPSGGDRGGFQRPSRFLGEIPKSACESLQVRTPVDW